MADLLQGRFRAKAKTWDLGFSEGTGTDQVAVEFEIVDGEEKGRRITWYGYFTEKTEERTVEALRIMGWTGGDIAQLNGLDANEVELVIEIDEYDGKERSKVQWVNRVGGLALKNRLDPARRAQLADRLRGRIAAVDQKLAAAKSGGTAPAGQYSGGQSPANDDIPF
jgi:hypothetical protein